MIMRLYNKLLAITLSTALVLVLCGNVVLKHQGHVLTITLGNPAVIDKRLQAQELDPRLHVAATDTALPMVRWIEK